MKKGNKTTKTAEAVDYSKPLKNAKHERFCQEYKVQLNATDAYKVAYPKCSSRTAEVNGSALLRNTKVAGRLSHLQSELSAVCGVDAQRLMKEWKKIGFANIQDVVGMGNKIRSVSQLTPEKAAAIESIATTKTGVKLTMHSKTDALKNMGQHIGFYGKDNEQKKDNLADFLKVMVNAKD